MESIIHRLADEYVGPPGGDRATARRWDALKRYVVQRRLTGRLRPQLHAVAKYVKARNLAAHAPTFVVQVDEWTQMFRYEGPRTKLVEITIDDLRREATEARAGYEAAQGIARRMDDDRPTVLAGLNPFEKLMLLGRI